MEHAKDRAPTVFPSAGFPTAIAWSPRGNVLAVGEDSGDVALFHADSETPHRVRAHAGPVQSIAWNPRREALLTTGQDGAVRLWDAPFATAIELVPPSSTWADHACWSPSGDQAAVAFGPRARVIEGAAPSGVQRTSIETDPGSSTIEGLAFTPTGKSLGVACYGGVALFSPQTGKPTRKLAWRGSMISIAFSPDGSVVACGCQDNSVHFWRIASGKDAQMSGYPAKPRSVAFNHDGRWLATSGDAVVSLWPFDKKGPEGRAPVQLQGHPDLVTTLSFAPLVDVLLSGSRDGTVALWAPPKLTSPVSVARLGGKVTQVAWGVDGDARLLRWAAADSHGRIMIGAF